MKKGPGRPKKSEAIIKDVKRRTKRLFNPEEKIAIVLEGLSGDESIAAICRREGIAQSVYYSWSKAFMDAGKARLNGDTKREADSRDSGYKIESESFKQSHISGTQPYKGLP
jgi:transposase